MERSIMVDIFFLDTNILIDYLENRDEEVSDVVSKLLLLNKNGKIILATSIFNIAELLEKELEIAFYGQCIKRKMSSDEIYRQARSRQTFFEEALEKCRSKLESKVRKMIETNDITLLYLPEDVQHLEQVCDLGVNNYISSQDVMIVTTALANKATYFLSNDKELVKKLSQNGSLYVFDLSDERQRETFLDTVLETVQP